MPMLTAFSGEFGKRLAQRWSGALSVPAFAVWATAGAVLVLDPVLWSGIESHLSTLSNKQQIVLGCGLVLLMTLSSILVRYLTSGVLALLAGNWPAFLAPLSDRLCDRFERRTKKDHNELKNLFGKMNEQGELTDRRDQQRYGILEQRLRYYPSRSALFLPTQLGNILRAVELRPYYKYGLNPAATWPAIRLLQPKEVSERLDEAYKEFNDAGQVLVWICIIIVALTAWILKRAPIDSLWLWAAAASFAAISLALGYRSLLQAARKLSSLFEICFDMFRSSLYESLRVSLPTTPAAERLTGKQLSTYLWRGYAGKLRFSDSETQQDKP